MHEPAWSYSGGGGNECVEVADIRTWTCLRDSKRENGPTVTVSRAAFDQVLAAVNDGTL
ncbi:DUF397 domain-containing protein [Streptomyces vietnamensis]|uniref:DUF397 domain-containing protein n=1 Tax=Streptomyces vietnamensis TaxID=362257 RepID=UPI0037895C16